MSDDYQEIDAYQDEERPRDVKIDEAKEHIRTTLFGASDSVYYQRQVEIKYEDTYFHWITAKALIELTAEGKFASVQIPLLEGKTNIRFYWLPRNRYWRRRAGGSRRAARSPAPAPTRLVFRIACFTKRRRSWANNSHTQPHRLRLRRPLRRRARADATAHPRDVLRCASAARRQRVKYEEVFSADAQRAGVGHI